MALPPEARPDDEARFEPILRDAPMELLGRMPWSSNATFLAQLDDGSERGQMAVFKPEAGERPLHDFPRGLWRREVAAYELSRSLGWDLVPATVARVDDRFGEGSLQRFVPHDPDQHYFVVLEDEAMHDQLRRICTFDLVANSTDRKGGHMLLDQDGHLWCIDNGLTFSVPFKLRTVIWDFAGEPIPSPLRDDVCRLLDQGLPPALADLLAPLERDAVLTRARAVVAEGRFPTDETGWAHPWPLV